jgi:putative membrane protein
MVLALALVQCASEGHGHEGAKDARLRPASRVDESLEVGRSATGSAAQLSDQQIAMVSDAFHSAVLDQAKLVYPKTKDAAVKRFAQTLLADHARARQEETEGFVELRLSPAESPESSELGVESGKVLFALRDARDDELDRKFVAAQVEQNRRFLALLEQKLVPNASELRVRQMLESFRTRVELHLEMALGIQRVFENP